MGYVYIMSNPAMPNLIKVGKSKNPRRRQKALSATSAPHPFKIEFQIESENYGQLEKNVQKYLARYRVNRRREFFETSVENARMCIIKISEMLHNNQSYLPQRPLSDDDLYHIESRWNSDYDTI
jgi:hypothetical protein